MNKTLIENQIIGQKVTMKFVFIGISILILAPVIIGSILFLFFDWPLIVESQKPENWTLIIALLLIIGIGFLMSKVLGRWAGKMIIDEKKS